MPGLPNGVITFQGYKVFKLELQREPKFSVKDIKDGKYCFTFSYGESTLSDNSTQVNLLIQAYFGNDSISFEASPYKITLEIAGKFTEANGGEWNPQWTANAIAILYPYARSIISSLTVQSGNEPIIAPTINVASLLNP